MFDLFRSRDKAVRILLGVILGVVAISMVTYLIPGAGGGGLSGSNDPDVVAQIGDDTVTTTAVMQTISASMRGKNLPPEMMSFYAPQVVEQLINERALAYEAKRLGVSVSDDDVANAIRAELPPQFIKKDGSVDQDAVSAALAQRDMTIQQFIDDTRRQMLVARLNQIVSAGIVVTKSQVEQEYKQRNDKVKVDYVLIKPAQFESKVQVSPADLESYYKTHTASYISPEKRSLAVILLDTSTVEQSINPSDSDLQSVYNSSLDRFRLPERVKVRHILLKTDKAKNDDAQVEAKAKDLLKQIQGGADFGELAKKYSQDPGSGAKGGELDFITRGQTVKPFEDAAFSLKPGQTSGLVKTIYGYHIIQVEQREDAHLKPFAEVKDTLAAEYKKRQAADQIQKMTDQLTRELQKDPAHPDKAAADVHGELIRVDNVKPGDPLPKIGVNQALQTALNGLKVNEITQPVSLTPNQVAVAEVTAIAPAHPSSLDEVRVQVETAVKRQKLDDLVAKAAADLAAKAKADGNDLAKAAKELNLDMKQSNDFNREGAVEGLGSASLLGDAFKAKDGSIVGPVPAADGKAVIEVVSHTPADMANFAAQQATLRDELKNKDSRERMGLFEAGVRKALEKDGKIKIHQDTITRLVQSFRS
ncbi:peptidylprolyl isomerase [Nevskia soli]|uniref:peptidylprolyl isomerase n=1 Tax=Nevskia soli TaxID=418856 RepID=UPI0015D93912|nr:peptidylprolyl isomerase [Nevskia soli]